MSVKITPEQISFEAQEAINMRLGIWKGNTKNEIADTVNILIEHGIVSPPVWVVRCKKTGKLWRTSGNDPLTFATLRVAENFTRCVEEMTGGSVEHWKGQE